MSLRKYGLPLATLVMFACAPSAPPQQPSPATVVAVPADEAPGPQPGLEAAAAPEGDSDAAGEIAAPAPDPPPTAAGGSKSAEAAFQRGRALFAEGKYPEACEAFEESIAHDPAVGSYLNLARCREMEGNVPAACEAYGKALQGASSDRARFTTQKMQQLKCP